MKTFILKLSVISCIFLASALQARSQERDWQLGPFFGANYPIAQAEGLKNVPFMEFGIEYAHSFKDHRLWIGAQWALQSAVRIYDTEENRNRAIGSGFANRTMSTIFFAEYRFDVTDNFQPFVGVGVGTAMLSSLTGSYLEPLGNNIGLIVRPRVGLQFWGHFRVTAEANFSAKYYNTVSLKLGWAF